MSTLEFLTGALLVVGIVLGLVMITWALTALVSWYRDDRAVELATRESRIAAEIAQNEARAAKARAKAQGL